MSLDAEEQARADFYGVLGRLFYAPPDAALLAALAQAGPLAGDDPGAPLALAWNALRKAAAGADADAVRDEFEAVFVGTGKAEVTPYTSAYTVKSAVDNPLVDIRDFMARHGIARRADAFEPEDHVAALCDVMRFLIVESRAPLDEQRRFFEAFLGGGALLLCDAIDRSQRTVFYRKVAGVARAFLEVEHAALDMK